MQIEKLVVAAIQMVSSTHLQDNLTRASVLIAQAAQQGAHLVMLPEYFCMMGMHDEDKFAIRERLNETAEKEPGLPSPENAQRQEKTTLSLSTPIQNMLASQAAKHGIWLIGGTIPLVSDDEPNKVRNTSLVYTPQGQLLGIYDKIHLFRYNSRPSLDVKKIANDATASDSAQANIKETTAFDETRTIVPGKNPVALTLTMQSGTLRLGLSICYDLRFPELYRQLNAHEPLDLIVIPAAFTYATGKAHWEILLRARAIENQCYVLAAAQGGYHENGRRTWGHSMLVSPWGEIIAQHAEGEGIAIGEIDGNYLAMIRAQLPALQHRLL